MFKEMIINYLEDLLTIDRDEISKMVTKPENKEYGDYMFPCFKLAKMMKKSPTIIAKELADSIESNEWLLKCENLGGYVNFYIKNHIYCEKVIEMISKKKKKYGSSNVGIGKKCIIEHTSINPNASPHIGRARNAIIGDFVTRLMKFEGFDVEVHYFVNDIGKQISMLVLGAQELEKVEFNNLLDIYVSINNRLKEDSILEKKVFELLYELENGNVIVKEKFRQIVDICIKGQTRILNELGIEYDYFDYESQFLYDNSLKEIINKLREKNLLFEDKEGRYVVNLEKYELAPLVIARGDKTSLYPLRDIAYTIWKCKKNAEKNIIVLGQDQELYFKQIAAIVVELGFTPPEVIHYSFVMLVEGKMSTRQGTVVLLEEFMNKLLSKVKKEIAKRENDVDELCSKKIAYSALKYSMEKTSNERNVVFDWNNALLFEGDTGPYILYSYVRINSILKNCDFQKNDKHDYNLMNHANEMDLIKILAEFPNVIIKARRESSPHIIAHYCFELAKSFNLFYNNCSVINAQNSIVKNNRIKLILSIKQVLENALYIMGMEPVEHM